jgi:hypothetical protein
MDLTIELLKNFGFPAGLVIILLAGLKWLFIEQKSERKEWREVIERQHNEIVSLAKESNLAITELSRAMGACSALSKNNQNNA